ncbi:MAG: hypothetical protein WB493_14210 [Anaeromyxobacteraceae bacterium]
MKRIALVVAVVLAACGTESSQQTGDDVVGGARTASVPVTNLLGATGSVKIALKTTIPTYTPIMISNPADPEGNIPMPCPASPETCPAGSICLASSSTCVTVGSRETIFYAKNAAKADAAFPVPCTTNTYTAEVFGSSAASAAADVLHPITEAHKAAPFQMVVAADGTCTPPTINWGAITFPTLSVPTIYVGLPAPNDTYMVTATGLQYPWSIGVWSVSYTDTTLRNPTAVMGSSARFAAPTTATTIEYDETYYLDRTLLVTGENDKSWSYVPSPKTTKAPTGTGTVSPP